MSDCWNGMLCRGLAAGLLAVGLFVTPLAAPAQDDNAGDVRLEQMTVTARGVAKPVSLTPGSVGVIQAEELAETTPLGLANAAARLAGVSISDDSPWGADISIRGLGRDSVVFLIDGCRVNMTTDLNGRFGLVNPQDVERIEILKGPVSTLYGSGSVGGVVNVITKKGRFTEEPEWRGETMATYSTNPQGGEMYGNLTYNSDNFWVWASGSWREADDYYSGGGNRVTNSSFSDFQGKIAAGLAWSDAHETTMQYQHTEGTDIGIPGTGTASVPLDVELTLEDNDRQFFQVEHAYRPESGALQESKLTISYQKIERNPRLDKFPNVAISHLKPEAIYETQALNWSNVLGLGDHTLMVGVDAWNWHYMHSTRVGMRTNGVVFRNDTPTPNTNQASLGLFAEDDWVLADAWILNLGLRTDGVFVDNEETATVKSSSHDSLDWGAHLGLTWIMSPSWSMTGLVAASYRSPSILERFKDITLLSGASEIGNPDLKSERSLFYEYGLHLAAGRVLFDAALFLNTVEDYISSQYMSANFYQMSNVARANIWGCEASAEWNFTPGWSVYGNIAYTEGTDDKTGEHLRFVAPLNGLLGLRQDLDWGLWWAAEVEWAAEQHNVPEDVERADSWATLNLRTGYDFELNKLDNQVVLALSNVFDARYHNFLATSRGVELREPGIGLDLSWKVMF